MNDASDRPRVLFFTSKNTANAWGGSEKYWHEFGCFALRNGGIDVHVGLLDGPVSRHHGRKLEDLGASVHYSSTTRRILTRFENRLRRVFRYPPRRTGQSALYGSISALRPDLAWFNLSGMYAAAALEYPLQICQGLGIPCWLVFQHCWENWLMDDDVKVDQFARVLRQATRLVFVSVRNQRACERAIGEALPNAWLTRNAVGHSFLTEAEARGRQSPVRTVGEIRMLLLGRLDPRHKGHHLLFEALADGRWKHRQYRLLLQGGGNMTRWLDRAIDYYGLPRERMIVSSHVDDVIGSILDSDLIVMPSISEGTPFAMVEGMACGRPAVGTPVGGIPELIVDGQTGWLARSTEVADIADALEAAVENRGRWTEVGAAAQAAILRDYDQDRVFPDVLDALRADVRVSRGRRDASPIARGVVTPSA